MTMLARLLRPMPPEFFPDKYTIAILDKENNIVFYRKDIYDTMSPIDQSRVLHLREKYLAYDATTVASHFKT